MDERLGSTEVALDTKERERVLDQVDVWRKQLINLARSNRLLYFRHTRTSTLEITESPERLAAVVRRLLAGGSWQFHMPPSAVPGDELDEEDPQNSHPEPSADELRTSKATSHELQSALRTLDRRATQEFMDKGIWILHLAVGILRWIDPDTGEQAESPVVLVPVELHRESPREPYRLRRVDEDVVQNPALALKLAEYGVEIPPVADEEELDLERSLAELDERVASKPGWEVQRRLVISPFSFHKEVMYRDLLANEKAVAEHQLIQALAIGGRGGSGLAFEVVPEDQLDEVAPPERIATILDADTTQMQCIVAAAAGRSFVMDGPPGTGKSQTIANVIAELLARGKSVLFVSEKAAALEVVHKRLWSVGLSDYCLELHSHKASRREVAQELGKALERHPVAPQPMAGIDLAQLTRRRRELSERARAMNAVRQPLGRSLHEVIGRIAQIQGLPQAPPPPEIGSSLSAEILAEILTAARDLAGAWGPVSRRDNFLWRDLAETVLDAARSQRTLEQINAALECLATLRRVSDEASAALLLRAPASFDGCESLVRLLSEIERRPADVAATWISGRNFDELERLLASRRELAQQYERAEKTLLELGGGSWREIPDTASARVSEAVGQLLTLESHFELPDLFPVEHLPMLEEFFAAAGALIDSVADDGETIAAGFGLRGTDMTFGKAKRLAELALLAAEPAKPEPLWISPANIAEVEQAVRVLEPLCRAFTEQQARLGPVFSDAVLELDLESLCPRFERVHPGFGKLSNSYRADKRSVAGVARIGKATKEVIALLPQALEWQRVARELKKAESLHAAVLGSYYYRSMETDFPLIAHALGNARRALEIVGREWNVEALGRELGRAGTPNLDLVAAAERLGASITTWEARSSSLLGPLASRLLELPLDKLGGACRAAAVIVHGLVETVSTVLEVAGAAMTFADARRLVDARALARRVESDLQREEERDRQLLGTGYQVLATNWDALASAIDWAARIVSLVGVPVSPTTGQRLVSVELDAAELETCLNEWHRARDVVARYFLDSRSAEVVADLGTTFEDAAEVLDDLSRTISDIDEWVEFERVSEVLAELQLGSVVEFCKSAPVNAGDLPAVIERACLERWADAVIEQEQESLQHLRADQLDAAVEEFRALDRQLIERAAARIIAACNERRPRTTVGAAGVIRREAQKQRRHMPVRRLLGETGEVAQALKPCFMMSPLTVSQFLPASLHFDAVIFDEASQVRPCDAINCVYRGTQLIIAGDDKQLPPTSFFEAVSVDGDDEWEEDQFEDFESIIKLGKGSGGLVELPLRWHYRSQHEDLITYSNFAFYDGALITFPGATAESEDLGVKLLHVPTGVYRRGTARDNPREAELVVDRVLHWARRSLEEPEAAVALGVVAFSEVQASAIETALDRRRRDLPELDPFFAEDRLDGFFIKNLENVQGDERDVMIFSVGYGRDEYGKLTMNFGPLNPQGGERRLNVAITRARRRVEMVSSITGTEPEFGASLADGPRHLQRYLEFAARGPIALAMELSDAGRDAESPFEEEVIRTIRSWGYDVVPQVGTAGYRVDIGVRHPGVSGQFALGVECDGRMYHSSPVARDRDRLRQEVLEGLGWRIYRIWGTSWYRYRVEQEQRLKAAIEAAIAGEYPSSPPRKPAVAVRGKRENEFEEVPLDEARSWTLPYRVAWLGHPRHLVDMQLPEAQPDLRRMILEVVAVEGPIEDELLLRRVREAWGVRRAGSRIRDAFAGAIETLVRRREINRLDGTFSFVDHSQLRVVRIPDDDELTRRPVALVSPTEQMAAVRHLVADTRRVSRDELTRSVCHLFGWNRLGADIAVALDRAVDALLREGSIVEEDGFLKPSF